MLMNDSTIPALTLTQPLTPPVPARGYQGLWRWTPPPLTIPIQGQAERSSGGTIEQW
jgi:hypothetical protein